MISCLERRCSLSLDPEPVMADIKYKLVLGRSNGVHLSPVLHDASLAWIREPPQFTPCFYGVDVDIEAYNINKIRSIRELGIFELQIEDGTNTFCRFG